jgi:hypothetical protein
MLYMFHCCVQTLTFTFDRVDSSQLALGRAMAPSAARPLKIKDGGAQVAVQALQRLVVGALACTALWDGITSHARHCK